MARPSRNTSRAARKASQPPLGVWSQERSTPPSSSGAHAIGQGEAAGGQVLVLEVGWLRDGRSFGVVRVRRHRMLLVVALARDEPSTVSARRRARARRTLCQICDTASRARRRQRARIILPGEEWRTPRACPLPDSLAGVGVVLEGLCKLGVGGIGLRLMPANSVGPDSSA